MDIPYTLIKAVSSHFKENSDSLEFSSGDKVLTFEEHEDGYFIECSDPSTLILNKRYSTEAFWEAWTRILPASLSFFDETPRL